MLQNAREHTLPRHSPKEGCVYEEKMFGQAQVPSQMSKSVIPAHEWIRGKQGSVPSGAGFCGKPLEGDTRGVGEETTRGAPPGFSVG